MKIKYSEIKSLLDGEEAKKIKTIFKGETPKVDILAYYSPEGANWSYNIGLAKDKNDKIYIVVTYCGEVKGGRPTYL